MKAGALVLAAALVGCVIPAAATADVFEPIQLVSTSPTQQADFAHDAVLSADGRYVAFDGSYGSRLGVWRRNLASGAVEAVAECPPGIPAANPCALRPSISADGRYVSFTTTMRLVPSADNNRAPDVYVRDMESGEPCGEEAGACEYQLASAPSGSTTGLAYEFTGSPHEEEEQGAVAAGRSAITSDGRHVVFETTAYSNLAGPHTPPFQIAVRDLETNTTRLVSVRYDRGTGTATEEPVPLGSETGSVFGAAYPGGTPSFRLPWLGASISADGSTVAWMGEQVGEQVPTLSAESLAPDYTEPLWRHISEGPLTPTRRVTGGGDPESAACRASGESAPVKPPTLADPCQGPFDPVPAEGRPGIWEPQGSPALGDFVPQLSADGRTVAFLAQARELASGESFAREAPADLYVANMAPGLTRVQALRKLTELAGGNISEPSRTAAITDLGLSADGSDVAFSTRRTIFALGSPAFISPPAAEASAIELYDADLADETLTRVTHGYAGEPSGPSGAVTGSPSFTADGGVLAFSSQISNLVYGDANTPLPGASTYYDGSDAFTVHRRSFSPEPAASYISPEPPQPSPEAPWQIFAAAHPGRDARVTIEVAVPGPGEVRAVASAPVPIAVRGHGRGARRASLAARAVAGASERSGQAGVIELPLGLAARYRPLATRRGGVSADVLVSFIAPGHATLTQQLQVTFTAPAQSSRRHHSRAARHPHRRSR